jgi:hypothetical protein
MVAMAFRKLSEDDAAKFRKAARETYEPFSSIDGLWHPLYQAECVRINAENAVFVDE